MPTIDHFCDLDPFCGQSTIKLLFKVLGSPFPILVKTYVLDLLVHAEQSSSSFWRFIRSLLVSKRILMMTLTVHIWELVSSKFYFSYFNLNCKKQMYYSTSYSIFFNVSNLVCKMLICILINSFMPEYEYLHYELNYLVLLANYMYNFIFKLYNL